MVLPLRLLFTFILNRTSLGWAYPHPRAARITKQGSRKEDILLRKSKEVDKKDYVLLDQDALLRAKMASIFPFLQGNDRHKLNERNSALTSQSGNYIHKQLK